MLLLAVRCAEAQCFKDSAELSANSLDYKITLRIQTLDPLEMTCQGAIDDPDTQAELHYFDGTDVKKIAEEFVFKGVGTYSIVFDLSAEQSVFESIQQLDLLYYIVQLRGNEPSKGSIQNIKHTQMNATSCWDDVKLYYNRKPGEEMLTFYGIPLNCQITNPEVYFQYEVENEWEEFEVVGDASYISRPEVYYKAMPGYQFKDIKYYSEERLHLSAADEKLFDAFFTNFQAARDINCRLKIISEVQLGFEEIVLGQIETYIASFRECFAGMNPILFVTPKYVALAADQQKYPEIAECPAGIANFSVEIILYFKDTSYIIPMLSNMYDDYINRNGIAYYFLKEWTDVMSSDKIDYSTYLTGYDAAGTVEMEASLTGSARITCIAEKVFSIKGTEACIDISFYDSDKCKFDGATQYELLLITEESGFASRKTYFSFLFDLTYSTSIKRFCSAKEGSQFLGHKVEGSAKERKRAFEKKVASGVKLFIFLKQHNEYIMDSYVHLEDQSQLLMCFFIMFGVVFVVTMGVAAYLIVSDAKLER